MKKEDFKKIEKIHLQSCKVIIKNHGACEKVDCHNCPFTVENNVKNITCLSKYSSEYAPETHDKKLLNSAKEFIKLLRGGLNE